MSATEQKTKAELSNRIKLALAKGGTSTNGIIAEGPMLPGKTFWYDVVLFSHSEATEQRILFRLFKKNSNEKLTKAQAIERVKALCIARQNYNFGLVNLFKNGRADDIKEYYAAVGLTEEEYPPTDAKARGHFAECYGGFGKDYSDLLNLLNRNEIDAAFVFAYRKQIILQDKYDSINKSKLNIDYASKQNDSELPYFKEMVKFLRPYTNSLLFQRIEDYYKLIKLNATFTQVKEVYDPRKYLEDAIKLIEPYKLRLKKHDLDENVLPHNYKMHLRQKLAQNNKAIDEVQSRFKDLKVPDPGTQTFTEFSKSLVLVDNIVNDAKKLAEIATANSEKILKLKTRIQQLKQENERTLQELSQQINIIFEGADSSPSLGSNASSNSSIGKNEALQKQKNKIIGQKLSQIAEQHITLRMQLTMLVESFDGDNIETLQQRLEDVTEEIADLKAQGQLLLEHIKGSIETFMAKQQAQSAAMAAADKAKAAEDEKSFAEAQKTYTERTQQHKALVALAKESKGKFREEQRKVAAAKKAEDDKKAAMEEKTKGEISEVQLRSLNLNDTQIELIQSIFSDPVPHHVITYKELVNLIEALGGEIITSGGGSHQHIKMVCLKNSFGFVDYNEELDTAANTAAKPTAAAGTLVRPHGKSHNAGTLSQFAIKQFRDVLERAGIKLAISSQKPSSTRPQS